jgi:hypothetical protein
MNELSIFLNHFAVTVNKSDAQCSYFFFSTGMTLLYRSQDLNPVSRHHRRKTVDDYHVKKFGHPYAKPYEDGDHERVFLPERQPHGLIVYHRYQRINDTPFCKAYACNCAHWGPLCRRCRPLNTTFFQDLEIPIDTDRFSDMQKMLRDIGMSPPQQYNWMSFWVHNVFPSQYSSLNEDKKSPIFFTDPPDSIRTSFHFMQTVYVFLQKKHHTRDYEKDDFETISVESVRIRTYKALIKWSLESYTQDQSIYRCDTNYDECYSEFTSSHDETYDRYKKMMKKKFTECIKEIHEEVAFRPHMVEMLSAQNDFEYHSSLL